MKTNKPAVWNLDEKTVTIPLTNDQLEKVKQWNFNVDWIFSFSKKKRED